MEAGPWTGKGYSAPWMYHRVAGQYTLLEKQLVSDFSPCPRRPSSSVLQDSTNWHDVQPPFHWGPLRQEGPWFPGSESKRAVASSPKPRSQRSPIYDGFPAVCRRELAWGAAAPTSSKEPAAPNCSKGPLGASDKLRGDLPARSPPSYEAHMQLRAGQGPRKENWPRPPPYVAPPSYETAHRTVRPQPRASRAASAGGKSATPTEAPPKRLEPVREGGPRTPSSRQKRGQCPAPVPGPWSYLAGARTWAGRRRLPERAEAAPAWASDWLKTPPPRSHTLPRATRCLPASCPPVPSGSVPQDALPARWGFSHNAGRPGTAPQGSRGSAEWKEGCSRRLRESPARATPQRPGGLMVIDATCVVIQTHYIPPARTERVRYVGRAGAKQSPASASPASPASCSLEERASRILGLPLSELGFTEQQAGRPSGSASPRRSKAEGRGLAEAPAAGAASVLLPPERAPLPTQGSPKQPFSNPAAPESALAEPPDAGLICLEVGQSSDGCAPLAEAEPARSPQNRSYVRDLREAMSRIRRHTAPDSDTDEELEKERQAADGHFPWKGRLNEGALSYSSSSSESISSNATVVPGNAKSATLRNGLERGWQLSRAMP